MPRKPRPLNRDQGVFRDASLIVIASEDTDAVMNYFAQFRVKRVQFKVLPTQDGKSSPDAVAKRLDQFRSEYATEENDQFWYCGDTDHWVKKSHIGNLTRVLQHCRQSNYRTAISNPCFELWLLLHYKDLDVEIPSNYSEIASQLAPAAGGYNKKNGCANKPTSQMVHDAVKRAKDLSNESEIFSKVGSTVYLIVEELIQREAISLSV